MRTDERRGAPRIPFSLKVGFPNGQQYIDAWTGNISADGLFLRTDHAIGQNEIINVKISFPGLLEPTEISGRVAWTRSATADKPGGVGLQITSDTHRWRLAELALLASAKSDEAPQRTYRILLVEDDPSITEMFDPG